MAKALTKNRAAIFARVLKTMIYSPEFWSKEAYRAKMKTPFELVASTARRLNADVAISLAPHAWVGRMGEPLFLCQPPTGYSDKSSSLGEHRRAAEPPEFFALAFASDHLAGAERRFASDVRRRCVYGDPETALTRSIDLFLVARSTRKRGKRSRSA